MNADEQRAYSRGYAAGKRRKTAERRAEHERAKQQAFWDRAFLAALPVAAVAQRWKVDGKPITTVEQRVSLAKSFATEALKQRRDIQGAQS